MRILQVVPHYVPAYRFGGPLQVAHHLGKALLALGHQVIVCTTNLLEPGKRLSVLVDQAVDVEGIQVYYEAVPLLERWGFSPGLARRCRCEAELADLVLVHNHFQFAGFAGARAARKARRPYVIFPHSSLRQKAIGSSRSSAKLLYLNLLERNNLAQAVFIAFNAEEELRDSLYSQKGVVIPNGIDFTALGEIPVRGKFRSRHGIPSEAILFGFLGRLDVKQKGLDVLLEGFAAMAKERTDVHLAIAGPTEGGGRTVVEDAIGRLGLRRRVSMPGLLERNQKLEFFADIDVFTLMSRYEGMSMSLLEAMYSGRPVLITRGVGLSGVIEREGAGYIAEFDAAGVKAALHRALDCDWRVVTGGRAASLVRERFAWKRIAEGLLGELGTRGVVRG